MDHSLVRELQVAPDETTASVKETKERGEATTRIHTQDFVRWCHEKEIIFPIKDPYPHNHLI